MRFVVVLPLLAASLPVASAQLNHFAKKAGLKYFGTATDTPGERERAGLESEYPKYDSILHSRAEFGQLTPANGMKWLFTEPEQGVFNWTEGDFVANLAKKDGQYLRCHNLVWHSQLAPWVTSQNWTVDSMTAMLTNHVYTVANHWKGRCYAWDVVNEGLNDDGTYRQSIFYQVLGEEYFKLAFRVAAQADPDAKLYYNDYNLEKPSNKSAAAIRIVKLIKDAGLRIDGIGMQSHWEIGRAPSIDDQIAVIKSYTATGVEVALTELDVRIDLPLNSSNLEMQKEAYAAACGACAQTHGCIGITVWDFYDPFSWVPATFPGEGNATLWFTNFTKHPAYHGCIDAFKNVSQTCKPDKKQRRGTSLPLFS